jgi:hypothetical protein
MSMKDRERREAVGDGEVVVEIAIKNPFPAQERKQTNTKYMRTRMTAEEAEIRMIIAGVGQKS